MSEQATETVAEAAPPTREEAIEAAEATLSVEDVAGTKPAEPDAKSDRQLVAPSIREFIRSQAEPPKPEGLELEVRELRAALDGIRSQGTQTTELTPEQAVLAKLETLEARESERQAADKEAAAEEAYNQRVRGMREGVVANITDTERFPGLVALEQQETVFNALVTRTQEGLETSEDEIASEVEEGLRTVYETLRKVYGSATPSEDQPPVSERKETLTPALSTTHEAADTNEMSRAEKIEYLWNKTKETN